MVPSVNNTSKCLYGADRVVILAVLTGILPLPIAGGVIPVGASVFRTKLLYETKNGVANLMVIRQNCREVLSLVLLVRPLTTYL